MKTAHPTEHGHCFFHLSGHTAAHCIHHQEKRWRTRISRGRTSVYSVPDSPLARPLAFNFLGRPCILPTEKQKLRLLGKGHQLVHGSPRCEGHHLDGPAGGQNVSPPQSSNSTVWEALGLWAMFGCFSAHKTGWQRTGPRKIPSKIPFLCPVCEGIREPHVGSNSDFWFCDCKICSFVCLVNPHYGRCPTETAIKKIPTNQPGGWGWGPP